MPRTLLPINVSPSTFFPIPGILSTALWMSSLLSFSLSHLYLTRVGIRYACGHGPSSLPLLGFSHSHYYRFSQVNHDIVLEYPLLAHDNDIWSPKLCEHLTNLQYVSSFEIRPYRKVNTFIETKVAAINCGDLTFN